MNSMSIRFQVFTNMCMADLEFSTPAEFMELFRQATDYITEGVDLSDDMTKDKQPSFNLVN